MAVQGPIPVEFGTAFPFGAYGIKVEPIFDFDRSTKENKVQERDKERPDLLMWAVEVYDADDTVRAADRSVKVKIAAPVQPVLPERPAGWPFTPVEFEGLRIRPWIKENNGRSSLAYSYSAKGVRAPGKPAPAAEKTPVGAGAASTKN